MKKLLDKVKVALLVVPALVLGFAFFAPTTSVFAAAGDSCTGQDSADKTFNGIYDTDGTTCVNCDISSGLNGAMGCTKTANDQAGANTSPLFGNGSIVNTVINVMLFIVGILCVIMIIYSGIRYVISRGQDTEVKNAKNTLLYAIVGLIIAMIAYALVNWVFTSIGK